MKRGFWFLGAGLAVLLAAGGVAAHYAVPSGAAYAPGPGSAYGPGYGYGPGMMGGYGPGYGSGPGYGYGPGMMGGYGPGMMGGAPFASGPAGGTGGAQGEAGTAAQGTVVTLQGLRFVPDTLQVEAGTTVTFVNRDPVPHDVVNLSPDNLAATPTFSSPVLTSGQSWTYTFDKPGTYPILCTVADHYAAGMVGQVIVGTPAADGAPASGQP